MSGDCWPEQDRVENWWRENKQELKLAVSEYRIEVEKRATILREALAAIVSEISAESDPEPALNFCRQTAQRALGLPVDSELIKFGDTKS